ncbi:N-acylglucosamine 2-epimerase [Micromonospora sp. ATCC 39149]|uniref:AGE family epimerase/isomerase n=1 Tax=Micromonospora carbonacea TaxID=47853 RepID=A0A7D6C8W5_9ACTN|nr:AGE family epimerase/isomerase [Micromonospora sp. ATCC 39149]EEP74730.1 N-acylglucosamine 2-epimerase [Micromonospora sp. ATCC 39149]QLK00528.1 AGE family epimerase/isomerase [Micromonospora carbonacea]
MTATPAVPVDRLALPAHHAWLDAECRRLLAFGARSALPDGGAAYLDTTGEPDPTYGVLTWITARTTHAYSLGVLLGVPGSAPVADAALKALTSRLRDAEHGGWFHALGPDGVPDRAAGKSCYDHAFVLLAASSAALAGRPGGTTLLADAADVYLQRFWDDDAGRPVDTWDADFTRPDDYRGLNATMHSVEALLAVADAVEVLEAPDAPAVGGGAAAWRYRAARAARFVVELAATHDGRLPEHFGPDWAPDLGRNRNQPADPFEPYGATPGHGLEWSRLLLHVEAAVGADDALAAAAVRLFDRAVEDGWDADGAEGFVYTVDWDGTPLVRQRMHWVMAEAIAAAAALYRRTGQRRYAARYAAWWDYAERHLLDHTGGSWWHELDPHNRPAATVWPGKPDVYHALQATLLPRLPLAPTLARALRAGLLGPSRTGTDGRWQLT